MRLTLKDKVIIKQLLESALANHDNVSLGSYEFMKCNASLSLWSDEIDDFLKLVGKFSNI